MLHNTPKISRLAASLPCSVPSLTGNSVTALGGGRSSVPPYCLQENA